MMVLNTPEVQVPKISHFERYFFLLEQLYKNNEAENGQKIRTK